MAAARARPGASPHRPATPTAGTPSDRGAGRGAGPGRRTQEAAHALRELVAPALAAEGVDLEELHVSIAGARRVVRLTVDADGGVSLDRVAEVSRTVSEILDVDAAADAALGGAAYVLEVSSPGVDRPLTEPRHWRRAVGRLVVVTLLGGAQVTGRLLSADDALAVLDATAGERELAYADVAAARVEVEFARSGEGVSEDGDDGDTDAGTDVDPGDDTDDAGDTDGDEDQHQHEDEDGR